MYYNVINVVTFIPLFLDSSATGKNQESRIDIVVQGIPLD